MRSSPCLQSKLQISPDSLVRRSHWGVALAEHAGNAFCGTAKKLSKRFSELNTKPQERMLGKQSPDEALPEFSGQSRRAAAMADTRLIRHGLFSAWL